MDELEIVEFKRLSYSHRIEFTAILNDGRELPFTVYTDNPRFSKHEKRWYYTGRIKHENGSFLEFRILRFNEDRFTLEAAPRYRTILFIPWLLSGEVVETDNRITK